MLLSALLQEADPQRHLRPAWHVSAPGLALPFTSGALGHGEVPAGGRGRQPPALGAAGVRSEAGALKRGAWRLPEVRPDLSGLSFAYGESVRKAARFDPVGPEHVNIQPPVACSAVL